MSLRCPAIYPIDGSALSGITNQLHGITTRYEYPGGNGLVKGEGRGLSPSFWIGTRRVAHARNRAQVRFAYGTVRQELATLVRLGLVEARKSGNRTYYRANDAHPLYPDIRAIVLKTCGLADLLRERLSNEGIELAFVFGSIAAGEEKAHSDIDLMVIGSISLRQTGKLLSGMGASLGREVNPHILTIDEFARRKNAGDHFLTTVLGEPKLFIIGSEDELKAMGERRLAASAQRQPARSR